MLNDIIIKLINSGISDQQDLSNKLKSHGYDLTQSTISRKLKQLSVAKINGQYVLNKTETFNNKITFVAPNLLVVITPAGYASSIAAQIDDNLVGNLNEPAFVGCIAGDDTIFVAVNLNEEGPTLLIEKLKKLID